VNEQGTKGRTVILAIFAGIAIIVVITCVLYFATRQIGYVAPEDQTATVEAQQTAGITPVPTGTPELSNPTVVNNELLPPASTPSPGQGIAAIPTGTPLLTVTPEP